VQPLPSAADTPSSEVMVDSLPLLPRWEVVREQTPGAAATHYIEDGVEDLARRTHSRTSRSSRGWKMGLDKGPLGVGEVGLVCSSDLMPGILPGYCFKTSFQMVSSVVAAMEPYYWISNATPLVGILPDRSANTFASWLTGHPSVKEVISLEKQRQVRRRRQALSFWHRAGGSKSLPPPEEPQSVVLKVLKNTRQFWSVYLHLLSLSDC
jgi:hypothetical protein